MSEPRRARDEETSSDHASQGADASDIPTPRGWYTAAYAVVRRVSKGWLRKPLGPLTNWLLNVNIAHTHLAYVRDIENDVLGTIDVAEAERVHVPAFWVVEYYSPSYSADFARRLARPDWQMPNQPDSTPQGVDALRLSRDAEAPMAWRHLATFVSPKLNGYLLGGARRRELPPGVQSIDLQLIPLGSALSAVVARFTMDEPAARVLDDALKAEHRPRIQWHGWRPQVVERLFVGLDVVRAARDELHSVGRTWLANELPGIFAKEADGKHPVLDMVVTEDFDPMASAKSGQLSSFPRALGLSMSWDRDVLCLPGAPGLVLFQVHTEDSFERGPEPEFMLWTKLSEAYGTSELFEHMGGRSPEAIVRRLLWRGAGLLSRLGLDCLADVKMRETARLRDEAHRVHPEHPIRRPRTLRASTLKGSLDLATIAGDVSDLAANSDRYNWLVPALHLRHNHRMTSGTPEVNTNVLADMARGQAVRFSRLRSQEEQMIPILSTVASLTASIDATRSQRWSLGVAILSLVSSGVAVWFAYLAVLLAQAALQK